MYTAGRGSSEVMFGLDMYSHADLYTIQGVLLA